jgi:hypothetical protein
MGKTTKVVLCAAAHCARRGKHRPGCQHAECSKACEDGQCWGCLPRVAADGLHLCEVDIRRIAEDAVRCAELHVALDERIIPSSAGLRDNGGGGGGGGGGADEGPPVPDDAVLDARGRIMAVLLAIVRIITKERGITGPADQPSAPDLAGRADKPDTTYHATRTRKVDGVSFVEDEVRTRKVEPAGLVAHRAGDPRHLAEFIGVHARWLAGHVLCRVVARELRDLAGDGRIRGMAFPSAAGRLYVGDCPIEVDEADGSVGVCGARLYQYPDQPLITCTGCGIEDTIEQWRRWLVGETDGNVDVLAIAAHLSMMWLRPVDPGAVKKWSQRGHIEPVMVVAAEDEPADVVRKDVVDVDGEEREVTTRLRIVRDRGRTLYPLAAAVGHAEKLWGPPSVPVRKV